MEKKDATFHEKNTSPIVKNAFGSIMLRAFVAASGTQNNSLVEGRMDSIKFQQILEADITPSVKENEQRMASTTG